MVIVFSTPCTAARPIDEAIILLPADDAAKDNAGISWTLTTNTNRLTSHLNVSFPDQENKQEFAEPIAWEYWFDMDETRVLDGFSTENQTTIETDIPLATIPDGQHSIALNIRDFEGAIHRYTRAFTLNTAPFVHISADNENDTVFDPEITVTFAAIQPDSSGIADIYLNNRPLITISPASQQTSRSAQLSELSGSAIHKADLPPGKHLLAIEAHSPNGGFTRHSASFIVQALPPAITATHDSEHRLQTIETSFPPSASTPIGTVEIHLARSVILAVNAETTPLTISRDTILAAFEQHNQPLPEESVTLIICATSANFVHTWQEVVFQ